MGLLKGGKVATSATAFSISVFASFRSLLSYSAFNLLVPNGECFVGCLKRRHRQAGGPSSVRSCSSPPAAKAKDSVLETRDSVLEKGTAGVANMDRLHLVRWQSARGKPQCSRTHGITLSQLIGMCRKKATTGSSGKLKEAARAGRSCAGLG
mgnify:FL=1